MSSIRYYNQSAPFRDFVANLESLGVQHPFFAAYNPEFHRAHNEGRPHHDPPHYDPSHPSHGDGPPPPSDLPPHNRGRSSGAPDPDVPLPPLSPEDAPWGPFPFGRPRRGHFGPHRGGSGARGRGGPCGRGGHHEGSPFGDFDLNKIGQFLTSQFGLGVEGNNKEDSSSKDFSPPADVFDTEDSYIVHISLPGAKKEDVGVNWDADKSELSVAGVIYRPGSEDFLKTIALDERKVGVFERKIRLGSRASPAQVDLEGISAKMEDGVLMVTIPKEDKDFVDVKKVDIE